MADRKTLDDVMACVEAALEKRGASPVVLDVGKVSGVTDYFVIVSGSSDRRVQAIAGAVLEAMEARGLRPLGVEGMREGRWVLVDYGEWIVHVFYEDVRSFYDLEGLWFDAPRVPIPSRILEPRSRPSAPAQGGMA